MWYQSMIAQIYDYPWMMFFPCFMNPNLKIMNIAKKMIAFEDKFYGLIYLFISTTL